MEGQVPVERSKHTAVMVEGTMYIWGGERAGRYLSDMATFDTNSCKCQQQFFPPSMGEWNSFFFLGIWIKNKSKIKHCQKNIYCYLFVKTHPIHIGNLLQRMEMAHQHALAMHLSFSKTNFTCEFFFSTSFFLGK